MRWPIHICDTPSRVREPCCAPAAQHANIRAWPSLHVRPKETAATASESSPFDLLSGPSNSFKSNASRFTRALAVLLASSPSCGGVSDEHKEVKMERKAMDDGKAERSSIQNAEYL